MTRAAWLCRPPVAATLNLLVPGGGLVLLGALWTGVAAAVLFTLLLNFTIAAVLLIPDNVPPVARGWAIGLTGGVYLGSQIRLASHVREQRQRRATLLRHEALLAARQHLLAGDAEAAWVALQPIADRFDRDLLVAYRVAQVQTQRAPADVAAEAWERVARLDRHRLYRGEIRAFLEMSGGDLSER